MAETLSFLDELAARRAEIPTGEAFVAQFDLDARLDEHHLAGELVTGRFAVVTEPAEPVGWEDRVRPRHFAQVAA